MLKIVDGLAPSTNLEEVNISMDNSSYCDLNNFLIKVLVKTMLRHYSVL